MDNPCNAVLIIMIIHRYCFGKIVSDKFIGISARQHQRKEWKSDDGF